MHNKRIWSMAAGVALFMVATVRPAAQSSVPVVSADRQQLLDKALYEVAQTCDVEKIKLLLEHGAHPNGYRDWMQCGPLFIAVLNATRSKPEDVPVAFKILIDAGADVHARKFDGGTILHALAETYVENRYLIPCIVAARIAGVDPRQTVKDRFEEKTALAYAIKERNLWAHSNPVLSKMFAEREQFLRFI